MKTEKSDKQKMIKYIVDKRIQLRALWNDYMTSPSEYDYNRYLYCYFEYKGMLELFVVYTEEALSFIPLEKRRHKE